MFDLSPNGIVTITSHNKRYDQDYLTLQRVSIQLLNKKSPLVIFDRQIITGFDHENKPITYSCFNSVNGEEAYDRAVQILEEILEDFDLNQIKLNLPVLFIE